MTPTLNQCSLPPPIVAYRRAKNLKDKLVKAKVPPPPPAREKRKIVGMKKCNQPRCETCPFVKTEKEFKNPYNNTVVKLNSSLDCSTKNVVYCLLCNKHGCGKIYIGQSQRQLKERFSEHKTSVRKKSNNVVGQHFSWPGQYGDNCYRESFYQGKKIIEKRESMWIERLEAEFKGLNAKQGFWVSF